MSIHYHSLRGYCFPFCVRIFAWCLSSFYCKSKYTTIDVWPHSLFSELFYRINLLKLVLNGFETWFQKGFSHQLFSITYVSFERSFLWNLFSKSWDFTSMNPILPNIPFSYPIFILILFSWKIKVAPFFVKILFSWKIE